MPNKINWDALGISASVVCAIHCAVLPVLLTSLPVFGFDMVQNVFFEYGMILLAFCVGIYALSHGFRKHHHRPLPLYIFSFYKLLFNIYNHFSYLLILFLHNKNHLYRLFEYIKYLLLDHDHLIKMLHQPLMNAPIFLF